MVFLHRKPKFFFSFFAAVLFLVFFALVFVQSSKKKLLPHGLGLRVPLPYIENLPTKYKVISFKPEDRSATRTSTLKHTCSAIKKTNSI